jgi:hypothetical protein
MGLRKKIWSNARKYLPVFGEQFASPAMKQALIDGEIRATLAAASKKLPKSPMLAGGKVFSQVDEDGIIQDICRKLKIANGNFIELGCGKGTENNSHNLLLLGWSGIWIDGSSANIGHILQHVPADTKRLLVQQLFITADNIEAEAANWKRRFENKIDLLSIDIDGNDALILGKILTEIQPKILVVEYNGKFPPPIRVAVKYNPTHQWQGDDYYGASLQVFVDLLTDYQLVSCNVSGANAFFVKKSLAKAFAKYSVEDQFMPARNHLVQKQVGGPASLSFLKNILLP